MRAKAVEKPDAKALAAGAEPVKTASTSQQSYDKLINHFAQLMETLIAEFEQIWTYLTRKCGRPEQHTCQSPHNPTRKNKALPRVPHPLTNTGQISKSKPKDFPRLPRPRVQYVQSDP